jgi:hypothetical protein
MKKIDKFKWTAVAAISTVVLATVVLAFVAPIYLITLWLGFCVGYVEVRALTLYSKELQNEKNILATDSEVKTEEVPKVAEVSVKAIQKDAVSEVAFEKPVEKTKTNTEEKKMRKRVATKKKTTK